MVNKERVSPCHLSSCWDRCLLRFAEGTCGIVRQSLAPGTIIDVEPHYSEGPASLENMAQADFLEFHPTIMKMEGNQFI